MEKKSWIMCLLFQRIQASLVVFLMMIDSDHHTVTLCLLTLYIVLHAKIVFLSLLNFVYCLTLRAFFSPHICLKTFQNSHGAEAMIDLLCISGCNNWKWKVLICAQCLTLLRVWDCPTKINKLEAKMERQKFTKIIDLSERIYLQSRGQGESDRYVR